LGFAKSADMGRAIEGSDPIVKPNGETARSVSSSDQEFFFYWVRNSLGHRLI